MSQVRIEEDFLGCREIPHSAYYGIQTQRALENFRITGIPISQYPDLINALATIKKSAAITNHELGRLPASIANAIAEACNEIERGGLHDQFVVDVIQGGAGTSTNMNANEVIANRTLEILGETKGSYGIVHPNDHVNLGQSTNDVYPTALRIASIRGIEKLISGMKDLQCSFDQKANEYRDLLKMGRTQLQDAVPMTLGQEFRTYAVMIAEDQERLSDVIRLMSEINLGGTAIGTGIASHPAYTALVCRHLQAATGIELHSAPDMIEATQDCGAFVQLSSVLKRIAVKLSKICNDLRLLSSGPRAGLNEINLPPMQAGSSIMPGKVNPVIPEAVNQVAFEVIGNDIAVTMAAEAGQLQLNAFEPIIAHSIFKSVNHLTAACAMLRSRCIEGITANEGKLAENVLSSISLVTALIPHIGYDRATFFAREAYTSGRGVIELVREHNVISTEILAAALLPSALAYPLVTDVT